MEKEREKRNVTVLSHLVPAGFHQTRKGTRHRACIILCVNTLANFRDRGVREAGSGGLLYLKPKEEDISLTDGDRELATFRRTSAKISDPKVEIT
jgi:hypothetical protein